MRRRSSRVVERGIEQAAGIRTGIATIESSDAQFLVNQKIVRKLLHIDPQVGLVDHFLA